MIILSILMLLLFFKNDKEINLEEHFLDIGKNYYQKEGVFPTIIGECKTITLEKLLSENMISNPNLYTECNKYNSYVKACKLDITAFHYTPMLSCDSINSEDQYTEWLDGNNNDITDDTDVRFLFLGYEKIDNTSDEVLEAWEDELENINYEVIKSTTYYRYRDKEWLWETVSNEYYTENDVGNVIAYYASTPNYEYLNSNSQTTTYKWYRNITVNKNLQKVYICKNSDSDEKIVSLNTTCENRTDNYKEIVSEYYTCGVKDTNGDYIEVPGDTICDCSRNEYGTNCEVKKTYYPSGENIANKESVYYKDKPVEDAIKDVSTRLDTTFRYYKEIVTITDKYYSNRPSETAVKKGEGRYKDWTEYSTVKPKEYSTRELESRIKVEYRLKNNEEENYKKINKDYLTFDQLIDNLQKLNYEVDSLKDIKNNDNLKYELKLQYRKKNK